MNNVWVYLRQHHQDIFRILLILIAILLITDRFPQHGTFKYDFETGKPWPYEDLIAPASFPILKSAEELAEEQAQVAASSPIYFQLNEGVMPAAAVCFRQSLQEQIAADPDTTLRRQAGQDSSQWLLTGQQLLQQLYAQGIVPSITDLPGSQPAGIINGNVVRPVPDAAIRAVSQAQQELSAQLDNTFSAQVQALLVRALQHCLQPNLQVDSATSQQLLDDALSQVARYRGAVQRDESIIRYGEIITSDKYQKLLSFREFSEGQYGTRNRWLVMGGYFILTSLLLTIFSFFVWRFAPTVFVSTRKLLFILFLMVGMLYLVSWAVKADIGSYYGIPFCIVPVVLRTFFGTRLSLYAHMVVVLLAGFFVPLGIEYTTLNLVAGMVAIFTNIKVHYWSQFFISIGFIFLTYSTGFLGIALVQEGSLMSLNWVDFGWLSINVFLTLLAYPLIPIFEKLFGYVSDITLMELGDLNKPLLKELQIKAPGTFQHSLQVANLAEAAASEIGANSLLVKVGSLYHDVGKMENPVYFIENQSTRYNPHDELPFDESARVIINHVSKGIEMAKQAKLPDILIDFIRSHHGTLRVEYFYRNYIKNFPQEEVDESVFRYPGPLPYSRETAIVMMADTVEAAARSLKQPTRDSLDQLVENLINSKIEHQQFVNSNITFKEITTIKKVFKKMLYSIYHVRIEYPE